MSIAVENLTGVYPAIITPLKASGDIDYPKLDLLIEDLIAAGVAGICACGTTGQSATLTSEEHLELAVYIHNRIDGRCQYMASSGSNSTIQSLKLTSNIEKELGPTTFLQVTGYYNVPPQSGIKAHFETIADSLQEGSNIVLYNVPSRTNANIEAATTIALAENPKIIGLKDAAANPTQCKEIIDGTNPENFRVLTGDCDQIEPVLSMGGFGAISATANLAPKLIVELVKQALAGDATAKNLQEKVMPLVDSVFLAKNPIPLSMLFSSELRLPMIALPEILADLEKVVSSYDPADLGIDLAKYENIA